MSVLLIGVDIMQTGLEGKFTSNISRSERSMLVEALKHYDFNVDSVDKVRSSYKICTDKGVFCLKQVSHGYKKAKKSFSIMKYLKEKGFENVVDYFYTKDRQALIRHREAAVYLTNWIEGREASFKSMEDILRCSELLAYFHNQAKGFEAPKHVKVRAHTKKWRKTFKKCLDELEGLNKHIDKLKLKAEFDFAYRNNIDSFKKEAEYAISILDHSGYNELCEYYSSEGYICHDSYYYQNILFDKDDRMFIVDLESCQYDMPVSDLGKFIRRILSKKRFLWDFDLCRKVIESYTRVRPMAKLEYELLLAMLVFPHKFWKLGKKRYIKDKKWNEDKYGKKLKRLLRERIYKREFMYCFINFYGLDIDYDSDVIEI